jgi:neopullulanase
MIKIIRKLGLLIALGIIAKNTTAQYATVYPTNWWAGMKMNKIQLLIHGELGSLEEEKIVINYPGIKIDKITLLQNKEYAAVDITINPNTKPGQAAIEFIREGKAHAIAFDIKPRRKGNGNLYAQGLSSKDLMYLIMPDRFSNGDYSNDKVEGMKDQTLRRDTVFNRHGGDLKGIQNHLDYFNELGVTALWLNPVLENDMPNRTEHGYAFTNHYKIDARLGGDIAYQNLIDAAHTKGLKIIQDAVYNHIGSEHVLFKNKPDEDWFHKWPKYTQTNYKDQAVFDPHASKIDRKIMTDGWFVTTMPDWNHNNKNVEKFLIQHAIWTVEEFGIDAWRIDTYSYNDLEFMNRCNAALLLEYPKIFMFGETWVHGVPNQSYFTENIYNQKYKSNLQSVTDFQTLWGIMDVVKKDFGWTDGVNKLYTILAQDFVYKNPNNNVVFLDNHDMNRFYSECGEDIAKYKMALGWLLTTRGIPQLYYGDELATTGFTNPNDGYVRLDFMGGWKEDKQNKFEASGRTEKENEIFNYIKTMANFRKNSNAITKGTLTQYVPVDAVYVYFKKFKNETVMVVMNTGANDANVSLNRFAESINGKKQYRNVVTNDANNLPENLKLDAKSIWIAELK